MTAPERIWAALDNKHVEYVRADLLARETVRADAAEAELAKITITAGGLRKRLDLMRDRAEAAEARLAEMMEKSK